MRIRLSALLLAMMLCLSLAACGGSKADAPAENTLTWQEQYDLGIKYLSDGNYEEAIIAFTAAIEIDPKQVDAYISLAEVYTAQGDTEKAAEILHQALEAVGDNEAISAALAGLNAASGEPDVLVAPGEVVRTERQELNNGMYQIWEYDANGLTVHLTRYHADGSVKFVYDYFYDAQGNKIAATVNYPNHKENEPARKEYTFDLSSRTIKEIDYYANGAIYTDEFLYSGVTVTISLQRYSPAAGSAACSFTYTMAGEDHEVDVYNMTSWNYETGVFNYVEVTERDAQENEVTVCAFDGSGNPVELRD